MERFYKRVRLSSTPTPEVSTTAEIVSEVELEVEEANINEVEADPGLRKGFNMIAPKEKDRIRRLYLLRGPFQPVNHEFPFTTFGKKKRRFRVSWFKDYASWLEYSISADVAFCLCCYLFKDGTRGNNDAFVCGGFRNWKKAVDRFLAHIGEQNSIHNQCQKACQDLMNRKQHINIAITLQSDKVKNNYRIQLSVAIDCVRFLLLQGLAFRGHDESESSKNRGNFLELLAFLSDHNDTIKGLFKNAPENNKLIAPSIQKDITNACSVLCTNAIISKVGDELFAILVDEARDVSNKEQMAVALRYVDKKGCVLERFIGIIHVTDTTAISLKAAVESLLAKYGLSITKIRGQGYDGASNMQGEFRGLKSIILADTRWGSHYGVILNLITLFPSVIDLLEYVENAGTLSEQRSEANDLLDIVQCYEFSFIMHLMKTVMAITNELSQALQRKDQDLNNAMDLVKASKVRFQDFREYGLKPLLEETGEFSLKNSISIPCMEDVYVARGRSRRRAEEIINKDYYRTTSLFYTVIDAQIVELNVRFNEVNTELLLCMTCLNPANFFSAFDMRKIIKFAKFYPSDFSSTDLMLLENQLQNYFIDVKDHIEFFELNGIGDLARKMVETKKHVVYPLVYCLIKLALILPVAAATVERAFSALKIVKKSLRNRMGDGWMNDCLLTYIEKDIFESLSTEEILKQFQDMKTRRVSL